MNRWLVPGMIILGVALIALAVWLDVRDGSPTMRMGDQSPEFVLVGGLGIALFGSGVAATWRAFKKWRDGDEDPRA